MIKVPEIQRNLLVIYLLTILILEINTEDAITKENVKDKTYMNSSHFICPFSGSFYAFVVFRYITQYVLP